MQAEKMTEFTYLGMAEKQRKAYVDRLSLGLKQEEKPPNFKDEPKKEMNEAQKIILEEQEKEGLLADKAEFEKKRDDNKLYIESKSKVTAKMRYVQGFLFKAGIPTWVPTNHGAHKKMLILSKAGGSFKEGRTLTIDEIAKEKEKEVKK